MNGHLEGKQPQLGDLLTMVINHLLNGLILQVEVGNCGFSQLPLPLGIQQKKTKKVWAKLRIPPEIAGLMIRAYENPLISLNKAGY